MEVLASASEGVMRALVEKLKALLGEEYALQAGVRGDIGSLESELNFMHNFLQDYASSQPTSAQIKGWATEVQELAYDAEDAVDEFTCRVGPAPVPLGIPDTVKHFVSTLLARRQIAQQVRSLRDRALKVSEMRRRYELPVLSGTTTSPTIPLPPVLYAETIKDLVGIDGPRDEIIAKLTSARTKYESGRRRVVSMLGLAGVGKTTLAMALYCSLKDRFQCRAFVTVSRKFETKRVLKDILQQVMTGSGSSSFTPDPVIETLDDGQIAYRIRDNLKDKRYLIVIDDLWEISAWDYVNSFLPENTFDSIIITTTRNELVANACCSTYHPGHFVQKVASLTDLDSRTLFFGRIFGSEENLPRVLEEVSMKILKKCAGLPLAIVCISSLLAATSPDAKKWEKVYNSLGSEMGNGLLRLKQALKVGYDDLPQHLKVCLLYLSAFPENCKIERDRLTRRWIAEGFVDEKPGKTVQEVAEDYFGELIERSMIQAVDVDCFGEVHACRIHDIIFELIAMKSFEENFVTIIGNRRGRSTQRPYVRRVSLNCGNATDDLNWSSLKMSHARSLTVIGSIDNLDSVPLCRFLRVLDFECCYGVNSRHLKDIGELFLLKYLSFKSTWIRELPAQIGELKCLETLDLTQTNVRELPVEVTRLQRLVHLLAGGAELPQGIGNMRSLQLLCIKVAGKSSKEAVGELLWLTNLRKLEMSYVGVHPRKRKSQGGSLDTLPLIISKLGKRNLQSLHLNLLGNYIGSYLRIQFSLPSPPDHLQSLRIRGDHGFESVPIWIRSLNHLADLELTVRMVSAQDLEIFAGLPRLVRFRLTVKESSREGIIIPGSSFPCLKELFISCRIMPVSFSQGVMPKLDKFGLQFRAYQEDLKFICPTIDHLQSFKEFQFTIAIHRGLSDREVEHLKKSFKGAVFI